MNKQSKTLKKRKDREEKVKSQLLKQRSKLTVERQLAKKELLEKKSFKKQQKEQERLEEHTEQLFQKLPEKTRERIEHNIKILKALEEEHDKEVAARRAVNKDLEDQGFQTFKEKLDALLLVNENSEDILENSDEVVKVS
jgi:hypothetical protein